MARKAIVDRNIVLQLLKEGKTSQSIATQFGVSRQAIDLHRKEFIRSGLLPVAGTAPLPVTTSEPIPQITTPPVLTKAPSPAITPQDVTLDQMIELTIRAFDALRRITELEAEVEKYRRDHDELVKQIEQLEEREKKRKEQEARWIHAQNPNILTNQ
jgi:transposase-like protein